MTENQKPENEATIKKSSVKKPIKIMLVILIAIAIGVSIRFAFFHNDFIYAGTLEATKIDLSAKIPSTIGEVRVHEGDHVIENQELVDLSCEDFKVISNLANENYARNLRLFNAGSTSKEVLDEMKNRKDEADVHVNWCTVHSPIRGIILSRYHEPGEWVNPGTKLLTLANIQDIWAYIYVSQADVVKFRQGMKLNAYLPELNRRLFIGKILKINDEAEFTPKNVQTESERTRLVFGVKVSFLESNSEEILKPGMTIEVSAPKD